MRVDVEDVGSEFLQKLQVGRAVVDEGAALGRRENLSPQDEGVVVVGIVAFKEWLESQPSNIESGLDNTFAVFVGEHLRVGTLPQQQTQSTQQNRLSRTGLAGDDHKAHVESDIRLANQCVVFNMQCLQHEFFIVFSPTLEQCG